MEAFGDSPRRVDIGFAVGQALSIRLREEAYDRLRAALGSDRSERWPSYIRAAGTVAIAFGANQAIKLFVRRRRPELPNLPPLVHTMSRRSYPSAHAATSAAGARTLAALLPPAPLYALA